MKKIEDRGAKRSGLRLSRGLGGGAPIVIAFVVLCIACGGGGGNSKYPSRSSGCDVIVSQQTPTMKTENIGPVSASCDDQSPTSKDDCLRELKDQVCKLGGDVVWGVEPEPEHVDGRWKYHGRAAHTTQ